MEDNTGGVQAPRLAPAGAGTTDRPVTISDSRTVISAIKKTYRDGGSAVRELVSNSLEAVRAARDAGLPGAKKIVVTLRNGRLAVEDTGIGLGKEGFEALRGIGDSTNNGLPGHGTHGTGFYAHALLADEVVIDTMAADGTGFTATCTGGTDFKVTGGPGRKSRGTTISMAADWDGETRDAVLGMLKAIGGVCNEDLEIRAEPGEKNLTPDHGSFGGRSGTSVSKGVIRYRAGRVDGIVASWKENPLIDTVSAESRGIRMDLWVPTIGDSWTPAVVLNGVPVAIDDPLPFSGIVRITDESIFPPAVGRDSLTKEAVELLAERVNEAAKEALRQVAKIKTQDGFLAGRRNLFLWALRYRDTVSEKIGVRISTKRAADAAGDEVFFDGFRTCSLLDAFEEAGGLPVAMAPKGKTGRHGRQYLVVPFSGCEERAARVAETWGIPVLAGRAK